MLDHLSLDTTDRARALAFYDAFVADPDGHRIEAVRHGP
jgi:catechol 2,3-dioxygenase-like lactoylglutathione lyase family enzyme